MNYYGFNPFIYAVSNGDQWSENQLNNLLADLWRYKGMLYHISIHGGNPLLYPHHKFKRRHETLPMERSGIFSLEGR